MTNSRFNLRNVAIIACLAVMTMISGCKKDNDGENNNGSGGNSGGGTHTPEAFLQITNVCAHPFEIYIDNIYQNICYGNSSKTITVNPGSRAIKVAQKSGYYQDPLITEYNAITFADRQTQTITIPIVSTGYIKIISGSSNPYSLYVNSEYKGTISGNSSQTIEVAAWKSYSVRVLQNSGYVVYPSEYTHTFKVDAGYIYSWTF